MLFKAEALHCPASDHLHKNNNPTSLLRSLVSHLSSVMTARATSLPKTKFTGCKRLSVCRKSKKTLDESWPIFCRFAVEKSLSRQMHFLEQVGEAACRRTAAWRSLICPDNGYCSRLRGWTTRPTKREVNHFCWDHAVQDDGYSFWELRMTCRADRWSFVWKVKNKMTHGTFNILLFQSYCSVKLL